MDSEFAILGCMLVDSESVELACAELSTRDFENHLTGNVFGLAREMYTRGEEIDLISVLTRIGQGPEVSALRQVAISASGGDFMVSRIAHYIDLQKEYAARRDLAILGRQMVSDVEADGVLVDEVIDESYVAFERLLERQAPDTAQEAAGIGEILKKSSERQPGEHNGIPTGFTVTDQKTLGMAPGQLWILAGRPGMGKTALALTVFRHVVAQEQKSAVFFSLEMPVEELAERMASSISGVPLSKIRSGFMHSADRQDVAAAGEDLAECSILIDDQSGLTALDIAARSSAYRRKLGGSLDLVVIDYLQLLASHSSGNYSRNDQVSAMSSRLKQLAKDLKCPVLCLSQLSRKCEERQDKRPLPSDLRDSGAIEQDADVIAFVYRHSQYHDVSKDQEGETELIVSKNRAGETFIENLHFDGPLMRFSSQIPNRYGEEKFAQSEVF